jgi:hypothetical protein
MMHTEVLSRGRGWMLFREIAIRLRTFPCLDLLRPVQFRAIENRSTTGICQDRSEAAFDQIRIPTEIAENP